MKMTKIALLVGILGFSAFSQAADIKISESCKEVIGKAALITAVADFKGAGINVASVPKQKLIEHAKEVDLPIVLETYQYGAGLAQKGYTRQSVEQTAMDAGEGLPTDGLTEEDAQWMRGAFISTLLCGFDDATQSL